jgi:hypothetical protein
LIDVGELTLGLIWDGESVSATDIRSTRPMAAQVLKGKTAAQVQQIVPLLFSVCGRAQGAAAQAALQAAQRTGEAVSDAQKRMIACEAIQEHLWRLLLNWPELLGQAPQQQCFTAWYALLRKIGAGEVEMQTFLNAFEHEALGRSAETWRAMSSLAELRIWWQETQTPLAQILASLAEQKPQSSTECRMLPAWTACEGQQACAGQWDVAFAARPHWQGAAAETGAWSYYADSPLLRDVWQQSGSKALTRLLARVMDVVVMAQGDYAARLDADSPAVGEGIAVVRTARGLLLHRVRLEDEKVAEYTIIAPTEWNFHPEGAFAQDMRDLLAHDRVKLAHDAQIEAMSLDPCVAYEVEIRNA